MTNRMKRLEAIRELAKHDHGILTPEEAQELADPFGVKVQPVTFEVGKGRVVAGPSGRWQGVGAHVLAHQLARSLGLNEGDAYPDARGIGSQLRGACGAVERYLESQEDKEKEL
jgi:hypothetical protein